MRVGVISRGDKGKKREEIVKICNFGAAEIYGAMIPGKKRGRALLRQKKRMAHLLREQGITICVGEKEFGDMEQYGVTVITDGTYLLRRKAATAAVAFCEAYGIQAEFLIDGGSFRDVETAVKELLLKKRCVYVRNAAFEELAGIICADTGAVIRDDAPDNAVVISMNDDKNFLSHGSLSADMSDFKITVNGMSCDELLSKNIFPLATILEKSGFLQKKQIKIEYFPK